MATTHIEQSVKAHAFAGGKCSACGKDEPMACFCRCLSDIQEPNPRCPIHGNCASAESSVERLAMCERCDRILQPNECGCSKCGCSRCRASVKSEKQRHHELLDLMVRVLHYQEHGDGTTLDSPFAEVAEAWNGELPRVLVDRYRNDAKFHAQVQRAVALTMGVMR
jgi:hypothetical protein